MSIGVDAETIRLHVVRQGPHDDGQGDQGCETSLSIHPKGKQAWRRGWEGALNVTTGSHRGRLCSCEGNWTIRKMK